MDKGRADFLELGDWNVSCFECGRKRKASTMQRHWQDYYVCPEHNEPRHPQDFARATPDVQTPSWAQPRPDATYARIVVDIPWTPGGSTISNFVLTDYITPSSIATTVIINIPQGVKITGSFSFGSDWPVDTKFIVNNNGDVYVTPDFLDDNTNVTVNEEPLGNPVDDPDYEVDWRFGQFPPPVLVFNVQPTETNIESAISPAIQVWVVGNLSVAITNVIFNVQLAIGTNAGSPAGTLSGTTTVATVDGVATFSNISIDEGGDGYTLVASVEGTNILDVISAGFNITANKATGGTISTSGGYTIHTFKMDDTFTTLIDNLVVDYLIVGGGGGRYTGGGGGGGLSYVTSYDMGAAGAHAVTVGLAGTSGILEDRTGGSTTFITTVIGGGGGGDEEVGGNGACGGGGGLPLAGSPDLAGGIGSIGFNGGSGSTSADDFDQAGGGGGGMGAAGTNAITVLGGYATAGSGGDGLQNSISGTAVWYSGGGAGDVSSGNEGSQGQGRNSYGGGGGYGGGIYLTAKDGIVIVRYLT